MSRPDAEGVLCVLKPVGPTSHDVVARARRWFPGLRVGHLGTLDPAAAGVLLLVVGAATRAARLLDPPETVKRYRAWAVFGLETDGDDWDGSVTARPGAADLDAAAVAAALAARVGRTEQVPPARSAVRVDGRRAYSVARAGEAAALRPRPVVVEDARLLAWRRPAEAPDLAEALIDVGMRRGGYVRALVRDVGRDVGTGACVRVLVRGAVGALDGSGGVTLEEAERLAREDSLAARLWPVERMLGAWPVVTVAADPDGRRVGRGRPAPPGVRGWVRLRAAGETAAWALAEAQGGVWRDLVHLGRGEKAGAAG